MPHITLKNGLVEFFAVVGISRTSSLILTENQEPMRLQGEIIDVFPEEARDNPLTRDLPLFCLPQGAQITTVQQRPKSFSFVLTNVFGQRYYCVALSFSEELIRSSLNLHSISGDETPEEPPSANNKIIYATKGICFVSQREYFGIMQDYLIEIYSLVFEKRKTKIPIENYIYNIVYSPLVPKPFSIEIVIPVESKLFRFPAPSNSDEFITLGFSFSYLFTTLDINNIITAIYCILLERKVLFISRNYSLLTLISESLLSLLFPLQWHYVYVPILPSGLLDYIEAPTPFLMGTHIDNIQKIRENPELVIVNIDQNLITIGEPLPEFPQPDTNNLKEELTKIVSPHLYDMDYLDSKKYENSYHDFSDDRQKRIRATLFLFNRNLFGSYQLFTHKAEFDRQEFLLRQPENRRAFMEQLVSSQAFLQLERHPNELFNTICSMKTSLEEQFAYLLTKFHVAAHSIELKVPNFQTTDNTYDGFPILVKKRRRYIPKSPPSNVDKSPKINFSDSLNFLNDAINSNPKVLEYYYLRAFYLWNSNQIIKALQDIETILDIKNDFVFVPELLENIWVTMNELESNMAWYVESKSQNYEYPLSIGPRIRKVLNEYEQQKIQAKKKTKEKSLFEKQLDSVEWDLHQKRSWNPEKIFDSLQVPEDMKLVREEFLTYAENTWPYGRHCLLQMFEILKEGKVLYVKKVTKCFQKIKENTHRYIQADLLKQGEIPIKSSISTNPTPDKGVLILTNLRLIFSPRRLNSLSSDISLKDIVKVEKYNYTGVIPPGVPCIKVFYKCENSNTEQTSFVLLTDRDYWYDCLNEIVVAFRISKDLHNHHFVEKACQRLILTEVVELMTKKYVKTFLLFEKTPHRFFTVKKILESKSPLNIIEEPLPPIPTGELTKLSEQLLISAVELFFAHLLPEGEIDFQRLNKSEDFQKYLKNCSILQFVDLTTLDVKETLTFFINIYNTLVIHSILIAGFHSSKLEWQYISRSASFSIGDFPFSLDFIKDAVLRGNKFRSWVTKKTYTRFDESKDPRFSRFNFKALQSNVDQRIHFVLSTHHQSSPALRAITTDRFDACLDAATKEFMEQFIFVSASKKEVVLPKIFKWYKKDFGEAVEILRWILPFLPSTKRRDLDILLKEEKRFKVTFQNSWSPSPQPFRQFL